MVEPSSASQSNRRLISVFFEVAVHAIVGDIQLAADEPFRVGRFPVEDLRGLLEPMKKLCLLPPELLGVIRRPLVKLAVFFERLNVGALAEFRRRRNCFLIKSHAGRNRARRTSQS